MRRLAVVMFMLVAAPQAIGAQTPDFLFGSPHGTIAVRSGWRFARADSDLFTFVQDQLTIDRKDFDAPDIGIDLDLAMTSRVNAVAGLDFAGSSTRSAYRNLLDNHDLPINQSTRLRELNLSGSIKIALVPRGHAISRHAWIPASVTPYVGAGVGALWYAFEQQGDFVDYVDQRVFPDTFSSRGWTPSAHLFGGVDVKAWRKIYFSGEARYLWSHATLNEDFKNFDPIDLAGLKLTGGVRYMF